MSLSSDPIVSRLFRETRAADLESPLLLALSAGLPLEPECIGDVRLMPDGVVRWDPFLPTQRLRALILRELSRWLLRRNGRADNDTEALELAKKINAYGVRRRVVRVISDSDQVRSKAVAASAAAHSGHELGKLRPPRAVPPATNPPVQDDRARERRR